MERSPSLTPRQETAPKDMSNLSNYTAKQLEDMARAESKGKEFRGYSPQNVSDNSKIANTIHQGYERDLQGFNQNFRGGNIASQGSQGHTSPFDTASNRYSPSQAPHINF